MKSGNNHFIGTMRGAKPRVGPRGVQGGSRNPLQEKSDARLGRVSLFSRAASAL